MVAGIAVVRWIERLKLALTVRLLWRAPSTVAEAVRGFHATEADGVWHLHRGMQRVDDPAVKAVLFTHSLEEEAHAEAFAGVYGRYAGVPFAARHYEREDLYPPGAAPWRLIAYVHVGERDATERFAALAAALGPGPLRDALGSIVEDESGHVDLTNDLLRRLGATDPEVRAARRRVRLSRAWGRWTRAGQRLADLAATALLSAVYWAAAPWFVAAARRRLAERVVAYDNSALKRL